MQGQRIVLVRHGGLYLDEKTVMGKLDLPLSGEGAMLGDRLGTALERDGFQFEMAYTSTLTRAREMTEAVLNGYGKRVMVKKESALDEIDMGEWDGKSINEIKSFYPREYAERNRSLSKFKPTGSKENFTDLKNRVLPCFNQMLRACKGDVLVVAHEGVNRVIIQHFSKNRYASLLDIPQKWGCCNILVKSASGTIEVQKINWVR